MTRSLRSPGSTLKPFIYGLAFEQGLVAQETLIEDRPADFAGYRPKNFDMGYQGDVSVRQALQLSLNVPAIRLLDAVGRRVSSPVSARPASCRCCRPAKRRAWQSGWAASAFRCATWCSSTPGSPMAARKALHDGAEAPGPSRS